MAKFINSIPKQLNYNFIEVECFDSKDSAIASLIKTTLRESYTFTGEIDYKTIKGTLNNIVKEPRIEESSYLDDHIGQRVTYFIIYLNDVIKFTIYVVKWYADAI